MSDNHGQKLAGKVALATGGSSPEGGYVTGANLTVDDGMNA